MALSNFNHRQTDQRKQREKDNLRHEVSAGQEFLSRLHKSKLNESKEELEVRQKQAEQVMDGFLTGMRQKNEVKKLEELLDKEDYATTEAHQKQMELALRKRDIQRKNEVRKAQSINRRMMHDLRSLDKEKLDEKVIGKVGISQ